MSSFTVDSKFESHQKYLTEWEESFVKHRRRRLSRSAIRKHGAEFDQRLREHFEQERRKRFSEFRDQLPSILVRLLSLLFVVAPSLLVQILAEMIWHISYTTSEGRLESSIRTAQGLLFTTQFYTATVGLCIFIVLYIVVYHIEQERWSRIPVFFWLVFSLMGSLFSLFVVLLGLPQALHERIQTARFAAFVDQISEQLGIFSPALAALVLLAAVTFNILILGLSVRGDRR